MKNKIYFYFFENYYDLKYLDYLKTKEEIEVKIEHIVSRMILHEHEDRLENIIFHQFYG